MTTKKSTEAKNPRRLDDLSWRFCKLLPPQQLDIAGELDSARLLKTYESCGQITPSGKAMLEKTLRSLERQIPKLERVACKSAKRVKADA